MANAQQSDPAEPEEEPRGKLNIPLKTFGGKQFWTDYAWNDGWRLQQSALTEHWRLLDPKDIRRAWGNREACQAEMRRRVDLDRPTDTHLVVLIHGLMRSSGSMATVGTAITNAIETANAGGDKILLGRPVTFEYASTRRGISEHADALRQWLESLPGKPRIDFVCHSMGNIVVRRLLNDLKNDGDPSGLHDRFGRFVMLGPPNQGADVAKRLSKLGLFEIVTGQGGMELGPAWDSFQHQLATPDFPFIVIAGDTTDSWLHNPLLDGPSDLLVRIDEARLEGSENFHVVPVLHSVLMSDPKVQELALEFLATPL